MFTDRMLHRPAKPRWRVLLAAEESGGSAWGSVPQGSLLPHLQRGPGNSHGPHRSSPQNAPPRGGQQPKPRGARRSRSPGSPGDIPPIGHLPPPGYRDRGIEGPPSRGEAPPPAFARPPLQRKPEAKAGPASPAAPNSVVRIGPKMAEEE